MLTIFSSSFVRPICLLSRPIGLHAWAPSMGTILKVHLSLLAVRQGLNILFKKRIQKVLSRLADWYWMLPLGVQRLCLFLFSKFILNTTAWRHKIWNCRKIIIYALYIYLKLNRFFYKPGEQWQAETNSWYFFCLTAGCLWTNVLLKSVLNFLYFLKILFSLKSRKKKFWIF